jgi:hypothetical protein
VAALAATATWAADLPANAELLARAAKTRPGSYPKWATSRQTYWTVVGVDGDGAEALVNEEGAVEVAPGAWSLEPFVEVDGRLVTWADVTTSQSLADGSLPIPSVEWTHAAFRLRVTAFAAGVPGASSLFVRYRLVPAQRSGAGAPRLWVALRPLQVLPPWQDLNMVGGVGRLPALDRRGRSVRIGARTLTASQPPDDWRVLPLEEPSLGSRALVYALPAGAEELAIDLAVPLHDGMPPPAIAEAPRAAREGVDRVLGTTLAAWRASLATPRLALPEAAGDMAQVVRATLAYTLVHRDGPAIQPGSRTYARSWIRDGALTSHMLLAFGHTAPVREFLVWYAGFQFPDGKIPCCVDRRGADPTPEHDSDGEFIYAVAEYWRYTRDAETLRRLWPSVERAAGHIAALRAERTGVAHRDTAMAGLVPESISHEGYHKQAVHSYWDDFFALRGVRDAAVLAGAVGDDEARRRWEREHADFAAALRRSLARVVADRKIDYVPGSVELADFDPTSTAVALTVADAADLVAPAVLARTFERYHDEIVRWRAGHPNRDAYTPYEARNAEALVRLGRRDAASDVLAFVLDGRRPRAWQEWAEVVWRDPAAPRFLGDMPHTWAAQAVVQTLRTMLVYEREHDGALVLAAGVPAAWLDDPAGVAVHGLPTHAGPLTYRLERTAARTVRLAVEAGPTVPRGGLVLAPPVRRGAQAREGERAIESAADGSVLVRRLPITIVWEQA